uniref:Uncharacterized protein n=2 Tax=Schistocephalus solidus TaxID=70667 RepID=A0A0X3PLR5_SCHSO
MMDIEIPLQSHDDFGSLEYPGALCQSQLDWEITRKNFEDSFSLQARVEDITLNEIHLTPKYPANECTFGEDFRTEFLTDLFGCEQNDYKHGLLDHVPEDRKINCVAECTRENLDAGEQVLQSGVPTRPALTEPVVPVVPTEVDLDMEKGYSALEVPQSLKKEMMATDPLEFLLQFNPQNTSKEHSEKAIEVTEVVVQPSEGPLSTTCEIQNEQREPVTEEVGTLAPSYVKKARIDEEVGVLPPDMTEIPNQPSLLVAPTGTAGTPLAWSSTAEPQLRPPCAASSAKRQPLPRRVEVTRPAPLHLTDLRPSLLPPVPPRAGRGKRKATSHILVDDPIEMTTADLRANLAVAKDLLFRRADVLAPPSSLTHPRRLLSLSVPRLLALPANWETALSACLGDCWKSKRRLCEALSPIDLLEVERPQPSKTSLEVVRESDLEASKEEARAHGTSSLTLPPSLSSLIGTSALDMTIQQVGLLACMFSDAPRL